MKDLLEGLHESNKGTFPKSRVFMAGLLGGDPSQLALDSGGTSSIIQGKLEEPDHSSANWYFPREELEKTSPSLLDGIDIKRETYFRKSYCTFLQDLGMRLKVPQVTIATAITFCHRFYLRQSHAKNDRSMVATVCMFLAGKVEETPRTLKDVIIVSYGIRHKKDPAAVNRIKQKEVYEQQKEFVLHGERLVLTTLGFDLNVHHPYRPLVAAIKRFKVAQHALAQVAWNFVNDGLRTSLCLQFKPHHIAAGAIFLAAKFLKVKLPNDGEKLWWQEFDVTPRQLEEVSNQMLELYEQNKVAPTSRSDPNPDDINSERNGLDSAVQAANGHYGTSSMANEPKGRSSGKRDTGGDIETRDGFMSGSSELERGQLKQKHVTDTQNGWEARRSDSVDRRRASMSNQNERASDMPWQPEQAETVPEEELSGPEAADKMDRLQESTGKRKREVNERKWVKSSERAEEGELPSRAEEHVHSSRATGDKRHEPSERDHGRREAGQDGGYRHHSEHHSSYHYQSQRGDGERSRTHSRDRDWQDREQKKSRHK